MSVHKEMLRIGLGAGLFALTTTMASTTLAVERTPKQEQPLVEECHQQALESGDDDQLEGKNLKDSNYPDYKPGEEYELRLSFLGGGNTFHNVTCHISPEGEVSYKEVDQEGLPSVSTD
ncbi:hypothetical protein [Halomonas sp. WWR20]